MAFMRTRSFPLLALAFLAALPAVRVLQDNGPVFSAFGMLVAVVTVGVLPGTLVSLFVGAASSASLLEAAAIGFGASFAIVQLLTVVAVQFHLPAPLILVGLWGASGVLAAGWLIWTPRLPWSIGHRGLWAILAVVFLLSASLYIQTPFEPWMTGEDSIHIAVIQRLAWNPTPTLNSIYWAPNFVYTYPFPGTHYFIALISRAADLDPLFVYQKARMLWGPHSTAMLRVSWRF